MGMPGGRFLEKIKYLNRPINYFRKASAGFSSLGGKANKSTQLDVAAIKLVHFRTLTVYPFSFPFGQKKKVLDALQLKFRPMTGSRENTLFFIPQIIYSEKKKSTGVAWLIAKSEVDIAEKKYGVNYSFWPAPLAFVPNEDGVRVVICKEGEEASAIYYNDKVPVIYRWANAGDGGAEYLSGWMKQYALSVGMSIDSSEIYDLELMSNEDISTKGMASVSLLNGLGDFDISNASADTAQAIEDFMAKARYTLKFCALSGAVVLILSLLLFVSVLGGRGVFRDAPKQIYSTVFAEEVQSPLSSANKRLRAVSGSGSRITFEQTLSNLIAAWKSETAAKDIKLDSMRYGTDMTEIQGLAGNMDSIQLLQTSLNNNGFTAEIGEIQQVSGTGIRFSIVLTEAK